MIPAVAGAVAASYVKNLPLGGGYVTLWQDVVLPPDYESRRYYTGSGPGYYRDTVQYWPGGSAPGMRLQMQVGAFLEASSGGHWIGLQIGGVWVVSQNMSEGGGGANLATNWTDVSQSLVGNLDVMDGADFADYSHFKFVDVYYRYVRA